MTAIRPSAYATLLFAPPSAFPSTPSKLASQSYSSRQPVVLMAVSFSTKIAHNEFLLILPSLQMPLNPILLVRVLAKTSTKT